MTTPEEGDRIYTKEAAKLLNVTPTTMRAYYRDPAFPDPKEEYRGRQVNYFLTQEMLDRYKEIIDQTRQTKKPNGK